MAAKGKKYICSVCECKFYDMGRSNPLCPRCGTPPKTFSSKDLTTADVQAVGLQKSINDGELDSVLEGEIDLEEGLWDNIDDIDDELI